MLDQLCRNTFWDRTHQCDGFPGHEGLHWSASPVAGEHWLIEWDDNCGEED